MVKNDIFLSIKCLVFNHGPYLRQCLEGIVKQQTNFRFEAIVHDDVSTDNSVDIIREFAEKYPEIIKPIYETENQYSKNDGSLSRVMRNAISSTSKYVATCEGDDYWTDPLKLQKQVDFLESHPDYGLVHTAAKVYDQKLDSFSSTNIGSEFETMEELLLNDTICTLTTCYRAELLFNYPKEVSINPTWVMGDYPFWLYVRMKSKVHFLPEVTAVYRKLSESASHSSDIKKRIRFEMSCFSVQSYFMKLSGKDYLFDRIAKLTLQKIIAAHIVCDARLNLSEIKKEIGIHSIGWKNAIIYFLYKTKIARSFLVKKWG